MTTPAGDSEADRLIQAALAGQVLSIPEIRAIQEHAASRGFDPDATERVRGRAAGVIWRGRVLRGRDRLPPAEAHYVRHVLAGREWPEHTTLESYLRDVGRVVRDPSSGIFVSRYVGALQAGFLGASGPLQGTKGSRWILIEYRVERGYLITAYQPRSIEAVTEDEFRSEVHWLLQPSS